MDNFIHIMLQDLDCISFNTLKTQVSTGEKIQVIKTVRKKYPNLGLREAKEIADLIFLNPNKYLLIEKDFEFNITLPEGW